MALDAALQPRVALGQRLRSLLCIPVGCGRRSGNRSYRKRGAAVLSRMLGCGLALGVALSISACGKTAKDDGGASSTNWGYFPDLPQHLIHRSNGATIRLCGANLETLGWAINVWGAEIGKRFRFVEDCSSQDVNSYGESDSYAIRECAGYGFANNMYVLRATSPMQMVDCGIASYLLETAILHEAGHLWGLCDQYEEAIGRCAYTTSPSAGSVMNDGDTTYLSSDDSTGIRQLQRRYGD
jgi:hypothetical protein